MPRADLQQHAARGEELLGLTMYESAEILILDSLRGAELLEILAHEWEHAEHPKADHRSVHRRSRQLAGVIAAVVDGAHKAKPRGR